MKHTTQERTLSQVRIRLEQVTKGIITSQDTFNSYWSHVKRELESDSHKFDTVITNLKIF